MKQRSESRTIRNFTQAQVAGIALMVYGVAGIAVAHFSPTIQFPMAEEAITAGLAAFGLGKLGVFRRLQASESIER